MQHDAAARRFMFARHPLLGAFLTAKPTTVFVACAAVGLLLVLLADYCGVLSLPYTSLDGTQGDVGYLATLNWSVMYCLVLPWIFAEAARLNSRIAEVLRRLAEPNGRLILGQGKPGVTPFYDHLKVKINQHHPWIILCLCLLLAVGIVVADVQRPISALTDASPTTQIFPDTDKTNDGLLDQRPHDPGENTPARTQVDYAMTDRWVLASRMDEWDPTWQNQVQPDKNLLFVLAAYAVEGIVVFLSFFYVLRFWRVLHSFGTSIVGKTSYEFDPWLEDHEDRLGLAGLGDVFTGFLRIIVVFLFYVAAHAIQVEAWNLGYYEIDYVRHVAGEYWNLATTIRQEFPDWSALFGESVGIGWRDPGVRILLATMFIPIAIIVYVPLLQLKEYVDKKLDEMRHENRTAMRKLTKKGVSTDDPRYKVLLDRWTRLQRAQVWPCGNKTALRYFSYMSLLVLAAVFPRIGILVCTGIAISVLTRHVLPLLPKRESS
jgi:hypothetical protein